MGEKLTIHEYSGKGEWPFESNTRLFSSFARIYPPFRVPGDKGVENVGRFIKGNVTPYSGAILLSQIVSSFMEMTQTEEGVPLVIATSRPFLVFGPNGYENFFPKSPENRP